MAHSKCLDFESIKEIPNNKTIISIRNDELPSINLNDIRLPTGEVNARDAIGMTKEKELLSQKGGEFELTLLLTQTEGLSYAWHLAKVAGENERQPYFGWWGYYNKGNRQSKFGQQ